jgi:predicted transcriptional regulator
MIGNDAGELTASLWLERAEKHNPKLPTPGSPMAADIAVEMEEYANQKLAAFLRAQSTPASTGVLVEALIEKYMPLGFSLTADMRAAAVEDLTDDIAALRRNDQAETIEVCAQIADRMMGPGNMVGQTIRNRQAPSITAMPASDGVTLEERDPHPEQVEAANLPKHLRGLHAQFARIATLVEAIRHALQCTPHVKVIRGEQDNPVFTVMYDCGDPWEILRQALSTTATPASDGERWRHLKRGTEYRVIARGELQASSDALVDGSSMVIYQGDDGRVWVREEGEFEDGRFERLPPQPEGVKRPADDGKREAIRAEIINTPETADFMAGVPIEAAHQRERWGSSHDAGKKPEDWFWLIGYLAQKALRAQNAGDTTKALHHTISTAAALGNWHAAIAGVDTSMRPGILPPQPEGVKRP